MSTKPGAPRRVLLAVSAFALSLLVLGTGAVAASAAGGPAGEVPDQTFAVSTTAGGELSEGVGEGIPTISADGGLVAFLSASANLNPEGDATQEAYVKDLGTGDVTIASRADGAGGAPAGEPVVAASLAADGRYLAFATAAEGIVAGVPAGSVEHVYRRDLETGESEIVDRASGTSGEVVSNGAGLLAISADGRLVAFSDTAGALDDPSAPHPEGEETIYVRDLSAGTTIEVAAEGAEEASFSADDRYLLFTSAAPSLPGANGTYQTYRRDLATGATVLVSRGNPTPTEPEGEAADGEAYEAVFVGRSDCRVAFMGVEATNLSGGATPERGIYVRDFCAAPPTTTLVSLDAEGGAFDIAQAPSTTDDGRIAFVAQTGPTDLSRLYLRDPAQGTTDLLGRASGAEGEAADREVTPTRAATVAAGGCRAVFSTDARNLEAIERPQGASRQTYVRQLSACRVEPEEASPGSGDTTDPTGGADGSIGSGSGTAGSTVPQAAPVTPRRASAVRILAAGRRGLRFSFDGAGEAFGRVQRRTRRGGWRLVRTFVVRAAGAGIVGVKLPVPSGGERLRLRLRLQGDPDNPTLTRVLGRAP